MKRMRGAVLCAAVLLPVLAFAEPKTADEWYSEGETQYNLGDFDKAAEAFKKGYALEPVENKKPAYLYNVAQAYRQGRKCKDAGFFYKRYLSLKDQDTAKPLSADKRKEIEGWIAELEQCEKSQDSIASKRPDSTMSPNSGSGATGSGSTTTTTTTRPATGSGTGSATVGTGGGGEGGGEGEGEGEGEGGGIHAGVTTAQPKTISLRATGGVAIIKAGDLTVPIEPSFNLFAGYPIAINDKLVIDVGANLTFTPLPYTDSMDVKKTANLIGILADAGFTYAVAPKIGVRGDLGIGALVFTGMGEAGNPFTVGGAPTTGALSMIAVRVGVALDYAFTPNVIGTLSPAFVYSPTKDGFRPEISSMNRIDLLLGVGYRM